MTRSPAGRCVYQLKVTLRGSRPPIWRRFKIVSRVTLYRLHQVLQVVMGWSDCHLHQFSVGSVIYGTSDPEMGGFGVRRISERSTRLEQVLREPRDKIVYEYDFGDGWLHDVVLEAIEPRPRDGQFPFVIAGKRACPPEDVGGPGGYHQFLEALSNPAHPDHRDLSEWIGGPFDPEAFDAREINLAFHGGWILPESDP